MFKLKINKKDETMQYLPHDAKCIRPIVDVLVPYNPSSKRNRNLHKAEVKRVFGKRQFCRK